MGKTAAAVEQSRAIEHKPSDITSAEGSNPGKAAAANKGIAAIGLTEQSSAAGTKLGNIFKLTGTTDKDTARNKSSSSNIDQKPSRRKANSQRQQYLAVGCNPIGCIILKNMAKFINTRKAVSEIEDLIKSANEKLVLVSPYLKLSKDFKELLNYRNGKDKITTIIFGKQELNPDEMSFLQSLRFVILKYNEDLHAKCYINDNRMIITSLNLYEFSMANNKEMGVLIDKSDPQDAQLYEDALKEVEYIDSTSQRFDLSTPKPKTTTTKGRDSLATKSFYNQTGYCIRTGVKIPFDVERPLCYEAFQVWNQFGDPEYPEKYCHFSGEPSNGETSVNRPILKKNWQAAKDKFGF